MDVEVYFDGACENNGSPDAVGGYGWWIFNCGTSEEPAGIVAEGYGSLKPTGGSVVTNNVAEWKALVSALEWLSCFKEPIGKIRVFGDSKLVIQQFIGDWKCKSPTMAALKEEAWMYADRLPKTIVSEWIPREQNKRADALSNRGLS